jgi:hypothetical protein
MNGKGQGGGGRRRAGPDGEERLGRNRGGGYGPGGHCVCAACGEKVPHERGVKCTELKCPKCGKTMVREELLDK